ncbi:MAG: hydrogenase [Actinobacteria bacterium]|nr:hydrogenase [Actinomycetota bacterium]
MGPVPSAYASGADVAALLVLLTEFAMLRAPQLRSQVKLYAFQSLVVVVLTVVTGAVRGQGDLYVLGAGSLLLKVVIVPALMLRLLRELDVDQLHHPARGGGGSMVLVAIATSAFGFFVLRSLGLRSRVLPAATFSVALAVVLVALLLVILRSDVISQAVGFFSLENGVSVLSIAIAAGLPVVAEVSFLFDLLVAVVAFALIMRAHHARAGTLSTDPLDRLRG